MAKTLPTIAVSGTPTEQVLELQFTDFRGQKVTKRIPLAGATTDGTIEDIVANLDMITNARITKAEVVSVKAITGMNASAQNALERNLSETMDLTFQVVDPINAAKVISRSLLIPAMTAALELTDGSPDVTEAHLEVLIGSSDEDYLDGLLSSELHYKDGAGTGHTGMNFIPGESHHISLADIVDNT